MDKLIFYIIVFIYGILIGSFLNVCIFRIPKDENIMFSKSHCMNCNKHIRWYDMVPFFSYILLGGKCRNCKSHISIQYPIIEVLNGILYVMIFMIKGWNFTTVLYCFVISALIVLSVIDFRTYTINIWINVFIVMMGVIKHFIEIVKNNDITLILNYLLGLCIVSGFLLMLYFITSGRGIGMGDINLMAASGFFMGWKLIILAFLMGCIFGAVIHTAMIKFLKRDRVLAFGPYLSLGILISMLYGETLITWYIDYLSQIAL